MADNNELSYPTMTRQRKDNIQEGSIAMAQDVNAEFDHIVDTYNRLIMLLNGEWGDGTGRIYDLVNQAVQTANEAITKANDCVQKSGDTMTGHLNIALVPASDYNVVNKKYVDDTIDAELADPLNRIGQLESWKENLNATQVKLENTNFTGKNVNDGMNELFISVSNGKKIVADAITGKGVATSGDDSFKQMADNINAILTFTEGTAGGTATADDIMYGKTAYARGSLIVGKYVPIDLSDATATSDKILFGYTAYVYGGKIMGTYTPPPDYPDVGIDTSNATATADDILYGKTAYARGQLLVGTLQNNVEELYGISDNPYTIELLSSLLSKDPNSDIRVTSRSNMAFSKENDYCVSVTKLSTGDGKQYIESNPVGENGLYILASSNMQGEITYKKWRYSKEELGINDDEVIYDTVIGKAGLMGRDKQALLAIVTFNSTTNMVRVHFYTYHLEDNGAIGRMSANETNIVQNLIYEYKPAFYDHNDGNPYYPNYKLASSNLRYDTFMIIGAAGKMLSESIYSDSKILRFEIYPAGNENTFIIVDNGLNYEELKGSSYANSYSDKGIKCYKFTNDDKYVYPVILDSLYGAPFYKINTEGANYTVFKHGIFKYNGFIVNNKAIIMQSGGVKTEVSAYVYDIIDYTNDIIKFDTSTQNTIKLNFEEKGGDVQGYSIFYDEQNSRCVLVTAKIPLSSNTIKYIEIYNMEDIISTITSEINGSTETLNSLQNYTISTRSLAVKNINTSGTNMLLVGEDTGGVFIKILNSVDASNIVAVIYKGQKFYSHKEGQLTAGGGDVRKGKTYIGWMGYPETGTAEF